MIRHILLILVFSFVAHAEGVPANGRCLEVQSSTHENPGEFYYAQFSGVLVPIPQSLVVVPRESGEREFSVAFMLDFEITSESELESSSVSSIFISKGGSGLAKDRYNFENEELCVVNGITVSHLFHPRTKVKVDELIYVSSPDGEKLLVGGSNLSGYKQLLITALASRKALQSEHGRSQAEGER